MNQANAVIGTSNISGQSFAQHSARLRTSTDNSTTTGLKDNHTFAVEALFDLSVPDEIQEAYGIRLTDRLFVSNVLKAEGDNTLELVVRMNTSGNLRIQFRNFDFITDIVTSIDNDVLDTVSGFDQIKLRMERNDLNNELVTASYAYGTGGTFNPFINMTGSGLIFQDEFDGRVGAVTDEKYIRAQFIARSLADVPEPGTLAIFGLGLAGLALLRRRKAA